MRSLPDSLAHWFSESDDAATQHSVLLERPSGGSSLQAFGVLVCLLNELSLSDAGRLGPIDSPNHARLVTNAAGASLVLKLSSDAPGDEPWALRTWARRTSPAARTPEVFAWGRTDEGLAWSLQEHLAGVRRSRAHLQEHLVLVLRAVRGLHVPFAGTPDGLDMLCASISRIIEGSNKELGAFGREIVEQLGQLRGPVGLVHGNLQAENLLWVGSRFSVVGAHGVSGPPSMDVARLLVDAHVFTGGIDDFITSVAEDLGLDEPELRVLCAAEVLLRSHRSHLDGGNSAGTLLEEARRCLR